MRSIDPTGYDAGKKVKGRKRHALGDTSGLLLKVTVGRADVKVRDAAPELIRGARRLFPFIACVFADGGYAGDKLAGAIADQPVRLEIVKRSDQAKGFVVIARRWVVERTFSWLRRNRRLAADFANLCAMAEAFIKMAMVTLMLRRLARH